MKKTKATILNSEGKLIAKAVLLMHQQSDAVFELQEGSHFNEIEIGKILTINLFSDVKGIIIYSGEAARIRDEKLYVKKMTFDENQSKRVDIKIPLICDVYILKSNGDKIDGKASYEKFYVHLKDISAGGIGFSSERDLPTDESYEFVFDRAREPIVVQFKIIKKREKNDGEFFYGCCFCDFIPYHEKIIREYVFSSQLSSYGHMR